MGSESAKECCVCNARDEGLSPTQAFVRGFTLGKAIKTPEQSETLLREGICLRHCHEIQVHEAWVKRNVGLEPPWPEEEPLIT